MQKSIEDFDASWEVSVHGSTETRHRLRHEPSCAISGEAFQVGHHRVETSPAVPARNNGSWSEDASTEPSLLNAHSLCRQRVGWRPTHAQVRILVGDHAGWLPTRCQGANTVSGCSILLRSRVQALFAVCGQHVSIDLRSDSSGAIGVASRRGLQRLRHLDVLFLWLQQETAHKKVRISKVPGPENVAGRQHQSSRQTFAGILPHEHGRHRGPEAPARQSFMTRTQPLCLSSWFISGKLRDAFGYGSRSRAEVLTFTAVYDHC